MNSSNQFEAVIPRATREDEGSYEVVVEGQTGLKKTFKYDLIVMGEWLDLNSTSRNLIAPI